jgi:hypothetical protein
MSYEDIAFTWTGDVTSISSYAQYARALLEPLIKGGATVRIEPMRPVKPNADLPQWWHETLQKCTKIGPLYTKISHCEPHQASANIMGGPHILLTHWPTASLPMTWRQFLSGSNFSLLLTTNPQALEEDFLKSIPLEKGFIPVPLDADPYGKDVSEITDVKPNTFVFGSVGYWNQKSNFSDLLIAYTTEFSASDNVALVIKTLTRNPNDPNEGARLLQLVREQKNAINKPDKPPVIIIQDVFDEVALNAIIRRFNCYVSTKRGTSVDISLGKCVSMGKPVITTNVGISKMYLNDCKALPKAIRMVPMTQEPVTMFEGGNPLDSWGRCDVGTLCKHLKQMYIDHITCDKVTSTEVVKMKDKCLDLYSTEVVVERFAKYIRSYSPKPLLKFT